MSDNRAGELTLRDAQSQVDRWINQIGLRYFSELTNLSQLVEEVGEVARIIGREYGDQSWKAGARQGSLGDELSDVLFVLICLANQTGVDLETAFAENLRKKTERDGGRHRNNPKLSGPGRTRPSPDDDGLTSSVEDNGPQQEGSEQ